MGKMGEVSGLNDLKTSSEWKECGQALWHNGKWAMSDAALCSLLPFCFNSHEQEALMKDSRCRLEEVTSDARTSLLVSRWWPWSMHGQEKWERVKHLVGEGSG